MQYRMIDGVGQTWQGRGNQNCTYFCYAKAMYSVAPDRVVEAVDSISGNVAHPGKHIIDLDSTRLPAITLSPTRATRATALDAHIIQEAGTAHVNDSVSAGPILARVGNSGSSTKPQLHLHNIADRVSLIFGNGVPHLSERLLASPPEKLIYGERDRVMIPKSEPLQEFRNDYPSRGASVTFRWARQGNPAARLA
jgi:hypothetical protein